MKYRCLTKEELETLEQDFVHFLAFNTITAPDWVELKRKDPDKAINLVEQFSDLVFDKVLSTVKYLEKREPKQLLIFFLDEVKIDLYGLKVNADADVDLTEQESINQFLQKGNLNGSLNVFHVDKQYSKERKDEIFDMIDKMGCLITDNKMYNILKGLHK